LNKSGGLNKINAPVKAEIVRLHKSGMPFAEVGKTLGLATGTVKTHWYLAEGQATVKIPESPYPRYDEPPTIEGDALILPDVEIPFHDAEFLERVFEIADIWKIKRMIAAGDLMHFDSLTGWEANFTKEPNGGISDNDEKDLLAFAQTLSQKKREELIDKVIGIGRREEDVNFSGEMYHARKTLKVINELFGEILWVMGNHEGRLLRAINSPVQPIELLNLMQLKSGKWKIAPYYYAYLISNKEKYRIEHPKPYAANTAVRLASIYLCHVLMGHSHIINIQYDPSGTWIAAHIGKCCDETRFPYEAQRTRKVTTVPHMNGAAIIRDGKFWLLTDSPLTDWKRMKGL